MSMMTVMSNAGTVSVEQSVNEMSASEIINTLCGISAEDVLKVDKIFGNYKFKFVNMSNAVSTGIVRIPFGISVKRRTKNFDIRHFYIIMDEIESLVNSNFGLVTRLFNQTKLERLMICKLLLIIRDLNEYLNDPENYYDILDASEDDMLPAYVTNELIGKIYDTPPRFGLRTKLYGEAVYVASLYYKLAFSQLCVEEDN